MVETLVASYFLILKLYTENLVFQCCEVFKVHIYIHTCTVPENPPLNPTGAAINSRTIQFSWGVPLGRHNGIIREYRVNVTEVQTRRTFRQTVTTTSVVLTSLQPSYTYQLSVSAYTIGDGPYSPATSVTTPEDGGSFSFCSSI